MKSHGGVFIMLFELSLNNLPRLGALRCAPCISRPCWGKASFGARLAARFLPILRRVRLCCGFWLPPPSQKPQRPNQSVYKNGWPLLPLQHSKTLTDAASKASCEQCLRTICLGRAWCGHARPYNRSEIFSKIRKAI